MLEGVGIGDLHYDKLNKLFEHADDLVSHELRKALDYAIDKTVDQVFFYGDICENARMSYEANLSFWNVLFQDEYSDLTFHIILGNHDFDEYGRHSLEMLEWISRHLGKEKQIRVYTQETKVRLSGVPVTFLPYPHTETDLNRLNVGHFETAGAIQDNGRRIEKGVKARDLALLGHLHTPHNVNSHYYSGTLYQMNFGESLPKGFHHFKVTAQLKHKILQVPNDPDFKLFNLEVWDLSDLESISSNPLYLYKVYVQEGVQIEPEVFEKFPNVVKLKFFSSKGDLKTLLEDDWEAGQAIQGHYQPIRDLKSLMKKRRFDPSFQKRVVSLHRQILEQNIGKGTQHG